MIKYKEIVFENLDDILVDQAYKDLLREKWQFIIINVLNDVYILTKEKSLFKIDDKSKFLECANEDVYFKTVFEDRKQLPKDVLDKFNKYIDKYRNLMEKEIYGEKYIFGSVAVRIDDESFITTIRGKEDLSEYTIVKCVDMSNHIVKVVGKKATLNAPLLAHLFENKDVDVIVHINHYFDGNLPNYEYAFPGTVRDSIRNNKESFNIKYHGVVYLFDKNDNKL